MLTYTGAGLGDTDARRLAGLAARAIRRIPFAIVAAVLLMASTSAAADCPSTAAPAASTSLQQRREVAAKYLQALHVAQAALHAERGRYAPLHEIGDLPAVPVGFVPRLFADQWGYIISLTDLFDACGVVLFSNHRGGVYEGRPWSARQQVAPSIDDRSSESDRAVGNDLDVADVHERD